MLLKKIKTFLFLYIVCLGVNAQNDSIVGTKIPFLWSENDSVTYIRFKTYSLVSPQKDSQLIDAHIFKVDICCIQKEDSFRLIKWKLYFVDFKSFQEGNMDGSFLYNI